MVILNRVINILILLAAIAEVVFSYLLFSKREKLVNGWDQMAKAINSTAKTLDDGGNSGTRAANELPEDKLKHENYEQLGQVLPKLKDNAARIVTQRNELADTIRTAATQLSVSGVDAKNLKNIAAYKDQERIFVSGVKQFRSQRDSLSREYARTFNQFNLNITAEELINPKKSGLAINQGNTKIKESIERRDTYANYLSQISRAMDLSRPDIQSPGYRAELKKILDGAKRKNQELKTVTNQLKAERRKTQQLTQQIASQRKTISERNLYIQQKDRQIKNLTNILNKDGSIKLPEKLLTSNDKKECYAYVRGVIEYVDKDYGFVTINIGRNYSFVQQYGIKKNRVLFPLEAGKTLSVARNLDTMTPLLIGKIFVTKVDDNSAVCNLIGGHPELYKEGDTVFFSDDDIVKALNEDKSGNKK